MWWEYGKGTLLADVRVLEWFARPGDAYLVRAVLAKLERAREEFMNEEAERTEHLSTCAALVASGDQR